MPLSASEGRSERSVSVKTARGRATTMKPSPPAVTVARASCCRTKIHSSPSAVNSPKFAVLGCGSVTLMSLLSLSTTTRRCGVVMMSRASAACACSVSASTISRGCWPDRMPV